MFHNISLLTNSDSLSTFYPRKAAPRYSVAPHTRALSVHNNRKGRLFLFYPKLRFYTVSSIPFARVRARA